MVIDESSRHAMFTRLQEVLGRETAALLMEHLPPVGWADVATKRDLDNLAIATKRDLDALEKGLMASFRAELNQQTRTFMLGTVGLMVSLVAVLLVAVR